MFLHVNIPVGGGPSCICLTPVVMVATEVGGAGDILVGCGWEEGPGAGPGGGGPIIIPPPTAPLEGGGGPDNKLVGGGPDDKLVGGGGGGALEEGGCW